MEPQELSPALLQTPVSVVALLGELLATLSRLDEETRWLTSPKRLYSGLEEFTKELQATLRCVGDTGTRRSVTSDDDGDPPASLSRALAAYKSTPWTTWNRVKMAAIAWQGPVDTLGDGWTQLGRKATKLRNAWRVVVNVAADREFTIASCASDLKEEVIHYDMAREDMLGLGLDLDGEVEEVEEVEVVSECEAKARRDAKEVAGDAMAATLVRKRMEVALGLLERLVAACDEAAAFPWKLRRLLGDIEAALGRANKVSPDVPEDLVAKAAMAKRLWEANARLAEDHLLGTLGDIEFRCDGVPDGPSAAEVAERCLRAIEDIPRLLWPLECPQSVPREPRELSPPRLQALVAVVATLGEVVATVTGPHRAKCLRESPVSLHEDLKDFTRSLCEILEHGGVPSLGHRGVPSLGRALAALRATPGTTWANVTAVASTWQESVAELVDSWDRLAREATKLRDSCGKVVMDQQLMVALDKEEVARKMARHDAQGAAATNEAVGEAVAATRLGMAATRRGRWARVALRPLQRLVAACDRATLFNWNMECRLSDIGAILKGINEVSPDVLQALVAKVAKFKQLWEASARLAKDHLLGTLGVIDKILLSPCDGPGGPGSCEVAERCQKAIEDIPRLLWGG